MNWTETNSTKTAGNGVQVPVIPTHSPIEALLDLSPMLQENYIEGVEMKAAKF